MATGRKSSNKTSMVIVVFMAIVMIIAGSVKITQNVHLKKVCISTATGHVQEVHRVRRRRSTTKYYATVSYIVNDSTYTMHTDTVSRHISYGEVVTVNYNPDNPKEAYCSKYQSNPYVTVVFSFIIIGLAGYTVITNTIGKKKESDDDFYY